RSDQRAVRGNVVRTSSVTITAPAPWVRAMKPATPRNVILRSTKADTPENVLIATIHPMVTMKTSSALLSAQRRDGLGSNLPPLTPNRSSEDQRMPNRQGPRLQASGAPAGAGRQESPRRASAQRR